MTSETIEETRVALEGRVALLLNEREIVINIGAEQGVRLGQTFGVYLPKPIEVRNPETGEVLGEIDDLILKVEARRVEPKFTICAASGSRMIGTRPNPSFSTAGSIIAAIPQQVLPMTIRAADSNKPQPIEERDSIVKVGYRVREISK